MLCRSERVEARLAAGPERLTPRQVEKLDCFLSGRNRRQTSPSRAQKRVSLFVKMGKTTNGHPNDPALVRRQLIQNRLTLTAEERALLLASIDRQIAEIDARRAKT